MLIYGVCISDITKLNEDKVLSFLKELAETDSERCRYLNDYLDTKKDSLPWELSAVEWLYDFESDNSYFGVAAFLREVIEYNEGINVCCDDPNGVHYLGISADAPWGFNRKTAALSKEEFHDILRKYINKITDDELEIRWWSANDDCDW